MNNSIVDQHIKSYNKVLYDTSDRLSKISVTIIHRIHTKIKPVTEELVNLSKSFLDFWYNITVFGCEKLINAP